ncbi:MAG: precorrin-2 C(20)-methyltransferase [Thermodesulfobacteriota bacterium]|nr:MAG: precorrin-2 C(20)-methyltransferase [Thermodesulfobacteriota bacterium]
MKLYIIGVGPGDPELLTLKAIKILEKVPVIFSPTGGKDNVALSIIEKIVNLKNKKIISLFFPMKKTKNADLDFYWKNLSNEILKNLQKFKKGAFITLGDPAFYSTFFYIFPYLKDLIEIEIIPGVTSISAAAGAIPIGLSIADEKIAILPANYLKETKDYLNEFDTLILMKPHKNFEKIIEIEKKLFNYQCFYIKKATFPDQKVYKNLKKVPKDDLSYFSIVIMKRESF